MKYKEITITLGYWDDHPVFPVGQTEWVKWVGDVTRGQVQAYGSGPAYSVKVTERDFGEEN